MLKKVRNSTQSLARGRGDWVGCDCVSQVTPVRECPAILARRAGYAHAAVHTESKKPACFRRAGFGIGCGGRI